MEASSNNLRIALDLNEFGLEMVAQKYRRANPDADDAAIQDHVAVWLRNRPLDADGIVRSWPR